MTPPLTSRNWAGKTAAGLVLGLALALGVSGLLAALLGVRDSFFSPQGQFTMWIIAPVWCAVLSLCFLFRSGLRAWLWLGLAAAAVWLTLFALGSLS
ncbi:MAG: hypothetical protein VYD90_09280 [Pseudomonadota bacterium]|nr:hypothetical protein [Pseudomonadota bacterium]